MENFSVVIITFNEEKDIGRCLASVSDLTDDIVVVDSGSTDSTAEICKQYPVRFVFREFDDYSSQKNFGNGLAKYDYIFSIDADECLSDRLKKSISEIEFNKINTAISFNRLNHHCGKPVRHGGWYPDKKIRIWNSLYGEWTGKIHEIVEFAEKPEIIHLAGDLLHFTYNSRDEHMNQAKKFSLLNAKKDFENGKKANCYKIYLTPLLRFMTVYFFKLGFLDGRTGLFVAKTTARATFLRYKELISLNCEKKLLKKS
jgi:glycosyltransferase involved in cell wall biosynthesis